MKKEVFGCLGNRTVSRYVLQKGILEAAVLDFGAALQSLKVTDGQGRTTDVVLGYRDLTGYLDNPACMGCVIAPSANRIEAGAFEIDGVRYQLDINDRTNNLHSHLEKGAHKRLWDVISCSDDGITLQLEMQDGELGFPGNRTIQVTYQLSEDALTISYRIYSDARTLWNPTNHSYFNLSGHNSGTVLDQKLQLCCHCFTPSRSDLIPTGELAPVENTPFDFTAGMTIGEGIHCEHPQLVIGGGYDHNFCIDDADGTLRKCAVLSSEDTGITMTCLTTLPGVQVYTANFLGSDQGKDGAVYGGNDGVCLETQFYPNAVNMEQFASPVVDGGQWHECQTVLAFTLD